jgi:hypothetical protein
LQQCCSADQHLPVKRLFCAWIGYYILRAHNEIY